MKETERQTKTNLKMSQHREEKDKDKNIIMRQMTRGCEK
jgi:hypothetical protein